MDTDSRRNGGARAPALPAPDTSTVVIGAGPAGLTAAYALSKAGARVTVLERDPVYVGGIARTASYKGYHFDIGGHRFFSKSQEVEDLWTELLPNDMLERPRSSRILYGGKYYTYPLQAVEALLNLGIIESSLCVLSYAKARAFPVKDARSLEDWVSNQFGERLFRIFFKTYNEKVWGMSCKEISADWAAQRIKGLSLSSAILNALPFKRKPRERGQVIKTLIDSFRYPRLGPGMMWQACADRIRDMGNEVRLGRRVTGCAYDAARGTWTVTHVGEDGQASTSTAKNVVSSAPIRELVAGLSPAPSSAARTAAESLRYRDFLTVVLIVRDKDAFNDNWIYIHDPSVLVGRIQNFKAWSPEMVPDPTMACYGLEYFCFEGDGLWNSSDAELIERGKREIAQIGLAHAADVVDGCVVRQPKAYPVYDDAYARHVDTVRQEIESRYPGLHLVGRNGMHKYNNQDHAMMTALLCARNILAGQTLFNVWNVNQDAEYHESFEPGAEASTSGLRDVPRRLTPS
jgi:protoporphyrinogen oxidase